MANPGLVPATRPDLSLSSAEADLSSAAVEAFAVALGGRQALLESLTVAGGTPDIDKITNLLLDPRYGGWSLRRLCRAAGLTIADLFLAYKKALLVRAHLQATKIVADQLVQVVTDVMRRSQPYEAICEGCKGLGQVTAEPSTKHPNPSPLPCPACGGLGRRTYLPELDRQKVALELGQLLQKSGINIQQNSLLLPAGGASSTTPGALEQLQQAVNEVLYPRARLIDPPAPPTVEGEVLVSASPAEGVDDRCPVPTSGVESTLAAPGAAP